MKSERERSCGRLWKVQHRSKFFAMAHLKQAAIGFRVHSGWAAVVAVSLEKGAPVVLARQRVHLVETFTYEFRQPYHTAQKLLAGQAGDFIERVRDEARLLAHRAIRGVQSDLQKQGIAVKSCGLLLASGKPLPALDTILVSHALIHTADGELFREALLHASARCGLGDFRIKEKELLECAGKTLRFKPAALMSRVTELGKSFGAPWSQDEKFATLAAWLALASKSASAFRAADLNL
jgi:hypothetical protein